MTAPTRYCPACFSRNEWNAERCASCGAGLASDDSYDERLVWALDHPDTATAMLAAEVLAKRNVTAAVDHLMRVTESPDPYRAAAAARALAALSDDRAAACVASLRHHPSALVRRAVMTRSNEESSEHRPR